MSASYTLYGAPLSLYTGKIRAYLTQKSIPYEEVFSSVSVYKKIIIPHTGVRFIPVVKTPQDEYLQDTAVIIDHLEARFPDTPALPPTPKQQLVSRLFEVWADEWLLIPAMHYRWNKDNFPFIFQEFGRVVLPWAPGFLRAMVGKKIGAKFRGFVPILGITPHSIPALETWYEQDVLMHLNAHFAQHDYLLGGAPTLGDYSLMGPLYAHLYRDPEPGKLMKSKAPHVAAWVERMNAKPQEFGDLLPSDTIADTLMPLLRRMFKEFWPVLANTVLALEEWALEYPDLQDIPRSIGKHNFTLGDTTESRAILPFHQWKMQRVLDWYQGFDDSDKASVDALLRQVDGFDAMQFEIKKPVKRKNNKLVFA